MGWPARHRRDRSLLEAWRRREEPLGGAALVRRLAEIGAGHAAGDVLCVACGAGALLRRLALVASREVVGVDPEPALVDEAAARLRDAGLQGRVTVQPSALEELPFRDGAFAFVVADVGIGQAADPARAVAELVRVARPGAPVALLALVWTGHVPPPRRRAVEDRIGAAPRWLVEWKQDLREAGAVEVQAEDWAEALAPPSEKPRGLLSFRLWGRPGGWGDVDRWIFQERVVGLALVQGQRWARGGAR